jgi:hypothetical protein
LGILPLQLQLFIWVLFFTVAVIWCSVVLYGATGILPSVVHYVRLLFLLIPVRCSVLLPVVFTVVLY